MFSGENLRTTTTMLSALAQGCGAWDGSTSTTERVRNSTCTAIFVLDTDEDTYRKSFTN